MKNIFKLPRWGIMSLIITTIILSFVILIKIWFPDFIKGEIFEKVLGTYAVLFISSAVISRMSEYLKKMPDDDAVTEEKSDNE